MTFVRIVQYDQPVRWNLGGLTNNLVNIDALLSIAALLTYPLPPAVSSRPWDNVETVLDRARVNASEDFQVLRCSYASPLDVVLIGGAVVSSVSGSAWLIANRALAIYNKYLDLKMKRSDVNLAIALNNEVMEHLRLEPTDPVPQTEVAARLQTYVARSASAINAIERIQVERREPSNS